MTTKAPPHERHVWISNRAFTRLTGIKAVCMVCRQPKETAPLYCPGSSSKATP
jgi:hypothetical protein